MCKAHKNMPFGVISTHLKSFWGSNSRGYGMEDFFGGGKCTQCFPGAAIVSEIFKCAA